MFPRFSEDNLERNVPLLGVIKDIAEAKGCTMGQIGHRLGPRPGR